MELDHRRRPRTMLWPTLIDLLSVMLTSHAAVAASIPATCQAAKHAEAGKLRQCLHKTEQKLVTSGDPVAYTAAVTKCTSKFSASWQKVEQKAIAKGASCPSTGDESDVESAIGAEVSHVTAALATGDTTALTCGNGLIDAGEDCDLGTFGAATCADASGGSLDFGTLACGGDCRFDTSGCKECPGVTVGGYCWLLSSVSGSCSGGCTAAGLAYDSATWFYAGASGTNAKCNAVLDALGAPAGDATAVRAGAIGCYYNTSTSTRFRDAIQTSSTANQSGTRRACACR